MCLLIAIGELVIPQITFTFNALRNTTPPMETTSKANIDWDIIIQTIREEKCILCLGPEIFTDADGRKLEGQLATEFDIPNNPDIRNYYPQDGLFLFSTEESKTRFYYKLKRFFDGNFPRTENLLEKIARIPFHLIISLTPDNLLCRVAEHQGLPCKQDFYWKNRSPVSSAKMPGRQAPLVYNMFGSIHERDSLVLTYQDLFDYFDSILGARSMPTELKKIISETDNFIFLGIQFERWYMQLLLRILSKYNDKDSFLRYASSLSVDEQIAVFCKEQFRITFVQENIHEFIGQLLEECQKEGLERQAGAQPSSVLKGIRTLIGKADTDNAIRKLKEFLEQCGEPAEELCDEAILLAERNNRLQRRIRNGSIDERDAEVKRNQMTEAMLGIIRRAENFE